MNDHVAHDAEPVAPWSDAEARHDERGVATDDPNLRLGRVLAQLESAAKSIRDGVRAASPPGPLRQPLDSDEHEGHWLTRPQVKDAIDAAATIEAIVRRLYVRMDPRCQGTLGDRPSWMGVDQFDPCRCVLPRDHDGAHACEHTLADRPTSAPPATVGCSSPSDGPAEGGVGHGR